MMPPTSLRSLSSPMCSECCRRRSFLRCVVVLRLAQRLESQREGRYTWVGNIGRKSLSWEPEDIRQVRKFDSSGRNESTNLDIAGAWPPHGKPAGRWQATEHPRDKSPDRNMPTARQGLQRELLCYPKCRASMPPPGKSLYLVTQQHRFYCICWSLVKSVPVWTTEIQWCILSNNFWNFPPSWEVVLLLSPLPVVLPGIISENLVIAIVTTVILGAPMSKGYKQYWLPGINHAAVFTTSFFALGF